MFDVDPSQVESIDANEPVLLLRRLLCGRQHGAERNRQGRGRSGDCQGNDPSRKIIERGPLLWASPAPTRQPSCLIPGFDGASLLIFRIKGCAMGQVLHGSATT
ncbi:hypothetical protein ACWGTO_33840, partial [Mesorhizobium sp. PL10]